MTSRVEQRRHLRTLRHGLNTSQRRAAAEQVARQFPLASVFARHRRIALYLASDGEIDPAPLLQRLIAAGRQCYLPVLSPHRHRPMRFARYLPGIAMRPNRFSIPEPSVPPASMLSAQCLDLVIMPLVGFDQHGNRLGMGGGFYDRTLAFLHHRDSYRRPLLVGLAYQFQCVDGLREQCWDVPLNAVLTDRALLHFR